MSPRAKLWTPGEFRVLLESGVFGDRIPNELSRGAIVESMPQGEAHRLAFTVLQEVFADLGGARRGFIVNTTLLLGDSMYDPEIALVREESRRNSPLIGGDVLWIIEVSNTSRAYDLGEKKTVYAENGIPHYWVVDLVKRGVWTFSSPSSGEYEIGVFHAASVGEIPMPAFDASLPLRGLFADL